MALYFAQAGVEVQDVGAAETHDEPDQPHHAELCRLVDQHAEPLVQA